MPVAAESRKVIEIPDGVKVEYKQSEGSISTTGPLGTLTKMFKHPRIMIEYKDNQISVICDKPIRKDARKQTRIALENGFKRLKLRNSEFSKEDVVCAVVRLKDFSFKDRFELAYTKFFEGHTLPARTLIKSDVAHTGAQPIPGLENILVEIDLYAYVPSTPEGDIHNHILTDKAPEPGNYVQARVVDLGDIGNGDKYKVVYFLLLPKRDGFMKGLSVIDIKTIESNFIVDKDKKATESKNGMVATQSPQASEAGAEMLKNGGNAVDASATMWFCLSLHKH